MGMFEEKLLYFIFIDGGKTKLAESNNFKKIILNLVKNSCGARWGGIYLHMHFVALKNR